MEIAPDLHQIGLGLGATNAFLLAHGSDVVLIDAGLPWSARRILNHIQASGHSTTNLTAILITHADIDHLGSLATLKKSTGAALFLHRADFPFLHGAAMPGGLVGRFRTLALPLLLRGIEIDEAIEDGAMLPAGLTAVHTPGHTPGSSCYYQPQRGILLLGDVLRNVAGLSLPPSSLNANQPQLVDSIKSVSQLDFEIACFGHGQSLIGGASTTVRAYTQRPRANP